MNNYIKTDFTIVPYCEAAADVLASVLADVGYESFVAADNGLSAYAPQEQYDEFSVAAIVADFPLDGYDIRFVSQCIEGEDWNSEWEKNYFKPIVVDDQCVIHSTFHTDVPQARYNIVVDPKMAFGTGYHQTTCHMIRAILACNLAGCKVLDMGCGTALLAILARKHGASSVVAVDIDEFAYENAKENILLNDTSDIDVRLGGVEVLTPDDKFHYIFANINRNILLADMRHYAACMQAGSVLFISGFYTDDIPVLSDEASRCGLRYEASAEDNRWAMARFVKE
ncbi:MAG: 50S ribosomal protein L11 methyltransferase [Bacteroidaceae bacterium]|nr:50S ribosomal protein L11 methyltransferase [Bacteroidaceae bacterium]MBQ3622175.1 50S ribosomal protein L11 methyltransferase [Bacteroidaceae bacterium]